MSRPGRSRYNRAPDAEPTAMADPLPNLHPAPAPLRQLDHAPADAAYSHSGQFATVHAPAVVLHDV